MNNGQKKRSLNSLKSRLKDAPENDNELVLFTSWETSTTEIYDEGETTMNTVNFENERNYLDARLYSMYYEKTTDARRKYGLQDDAPPQTVKEIVERIKSGKFTYDEKKDARKDYYLDAFTRIRWRDPALVEDQAGFDKAEKELNAAFNKAKDQIKVLDPTTGLAALNEFQTYTIQ